MAVAVPLTYVAVTLTLLTGPLPQRLAFQVPFGVGSAPWLRPAVRMQHGVSGWAFRGLAGGFGRDGAGWRPVRSGGCCSRVGARGLIGMACLPARGAGSS